VKHLAKIFFYLLFSVLLGAVVAPWIYVGIQRVPAVDFGNIASFILEVQKMPFHRYFSRSIQVTALLLLWPTFRWLGIYDLVGYSIYPNKYARVDLLVGIFSALLPLALLEILFLWKGWYVFTPMVNLLLLMKFLMTAVVVAILEEYFFRGLLLGICRRAFGDQGALWLTSLFFAALHFLNMPHGGEISVDWFSGLRLLGEVGEGLPEMPLLLGAFTTLTLLGIILAWVTLRTHSLWLAIGLHAAWIFGQQSFNHIAHYTLSPADRVFPWLGVPQVHGMVPVGLLPLLSLVLTLVFLKIWCDLKHSNS
jgi:membrane protease YdiL (CAAX protease family)